MIYFVGIVLCLIISVNAYMQQPKFGKTPSGERLERIKKSPNYKEGTFKNLSHTPDLTEGVSYYSVLNEFLFTKKVRMKPVDTLPSVKTDLGNLKEDENSLVWFGHSSYFMKLDGKVIVVDPVLSGVASPLPFTTNSFKGTDIYSPDDFPEIDYLFISHDHWDHLDYDTIKRLKPKINRVICGLGIGEHFEYWGFDKAIISEYDWHDKVLMEEGFECFTAPARHFSGRTFKRNKALWLSFILKTPSLKIFIGGDSGYDSHFKEIGITYGPFDLAILENGQYDKSWKYIHMMPDEVLKAAKELRTNRMFPVHSAKFSLGNHSWDEPLKKITEFNRMEKVNMITPVIGEKVNLADTSQAFTEWWINYN